MTCLLGTFGLQLFEIELGLGMYCLEPEDLLEPADDGVGVVAIELDAIPASPGFLGRDEGRSTSGERIEDDAAALGAIQNRIGNHCDGLDRRVHDKIVCAVFAKAGRSPVVPDVSAV